MTVDKLAVSRGRKLVEDLRRYLPAGIHPSTGVSVRCVHEQCLFYLATRREI